MDEPAANAGRFAPFWPALIRVSVNVIARNRYVHIRNIAFLMGQQGRWSLSPAFDMSCSYNLQSDCTDLHQMTSNGKRATITP